MATSRLGLWLALSAILPACSHIPSTSESTPPRTEHDTAASRHTQPPKTSLPAPNPQTHSFASEPSPAHHTEMADQTSSPSQSPEQKALQPLLTTRVTPG